MFVHGYIGLIRFLVLLITLQFLPFLDALFKLNRKPFPFVPGLELAVVMELFGCGGDDNFVGFGDAKIAHGGAVEASQLESAPRCIL